MSFNKMYIVSPHKDLNKAVFSYVFDSDAKEIAEKFASDATKSLWDLWQDVGCPSGFSGCEGLMLYVHETSDTDQRAFSPIGAYVSGRRFDPDHFDPGTIPSPLRKFILKVFEGFGPDASMSSKILELGSQLMQEIMRYGESSSVITGRRL
jgi:hypothetical protein